MDSSVLVVNPSAEPAAMSTPLVILHGLLSCPYDWTPFTKLMSNVLACRVYCIPLRNHAMHAGDEPKPMSMANMAQDVVDFVKANDVEGPVHVVAHSIGGQVAQWAALHQMLDIKKLVVVDIAPRAYAIQELGETDIILKAVDEVNTDAFKSRDEIGQVFTKHHVNHFTAEYFKWKAVETAAGGKYTFQIPTQSIRDGVDAFYKEWTTTSFERASSVHVLFIRGARSHYICDSDVSLIKRLFTDSRIELFAESSHFPIIEQPYAFAEAIFLFLSGIN